MQNQSVLLSANAAAASLCCGHDAVYSHNRTLKWHVSPACVTDTLACFNQQILFEGVWQDPVDTASSMDAKERAVH